jgi:hypothetical protein
LIFLGSMRKPRVVNPSCGVGEFGVLFMVCMVYCCWKL